MRFFFFSLVYLIFFLLNIVIINIKKIIKVAFLIKIGKTMLFC